MIGIWIGMLLDEDDAIGLRLSEEGLRNPDCSG
jgi:hypothetical protein